MRLERLSRPSLAVWMALACAGSGAAAQNPLGPAGGPFEIRDTTRSISSGAFPNSSRLFAQQLVSERVVLYRGKPVSVKTAGGNVSAFYEAWTLDGAPLPAVLLALQGFYLLTEQGGQLAIKVLSPEQGDIATLQWLDAGDGQPLPQREVTVRDRRGEPRVLNEGRLLLLNHDVVLDAKTLRVYPVSAPLHSPAVNDFAVASEPAKALSPDATAYVLAGSRDRGGRDEDALVVVDFTADRAYAVPYDRKRMGVEPPWGINPAWLQNHFQWRRQADGALRLSPQPGSAAARATR